jgi:calcineurin-like phosphoesterase family protein
LNIWVCSDWHFNHDKDFIWGARGFESVEEMNQEIVRRHNELVRPEDIVYVLGDLCLGPNLEDNKRLIESMNGNLRIILGNHDTIKRQEMYATCRNVVNISQSYMMYKSKPMILFNHFPTLVSNNDDKKPFKAKILNICGHTHTLARFYDWDKGMIYHVDMEAHDCRPVRLNEIVKECREWNLRYTKN